MKSSLLRVPPVPDKELNKIDENSDPDGKEVIWMELKLLLLKVLSELDKELAKTNKDLDLDDEEVIWIKLNEEPTDNSIWELLSISK